MGYVGRGPESKSAEKTAELSPACGNGFWELAVNGIQPGKSDVSVGEHDFSPLSAGASTLTGSWEPGPRP